MTYLTAILFTGHNPFVLWKMFNIELIIIAFEYILIFYLGLLKKIEITKKVIFFLLFIIIMVLPWRMFQGEIKEFGIIVRILPIILFMSSYRNGIIFLQTFFIFFGLNFIVSAANYILLKNGVPAQQVQLGELAGTTRYNLGFAVSTSFFETGNLILARFQGFAWEPAPLGILSLISLLILRKIGVYTTKLQNILVIFSMIFSKSIAVYFGIIFYSFLKQRFTVLLILSVTITIILMLNYSIIQHFFVENTSIIVRLSQLTSFFVNLNAIEIIVGSGYGVYDQHQTNFFTQWTKDFGLVRTLVATICLAVLLKSRLGWPTCLTIVLLLSSLNLAFSNFFIGLVSFLFFHDKKIR